MWSRQSLWLLRPTKVAQCRNLWGLGSAKRQNRVMSYAERRVIGFSAEQMFDVVYTVADYPKFVPWCKGADVHKRSERAFDAELWIGFPPLHEHYTSRVTSLYPYVVNSYCTDGRLFHVLDTTWRFGPGPEGSPKQSCTLHFTLQFEFKSALNAQLSQMFFGQVVRKMVTAFLCRAEHCYGPPSLDHFKQQPEILTQQ
ncbi:polyketide cyclase / dehydrase and lipid transport domain-containing protein [Ditylenchus destructor]|uniref:Polyketide cyclase / dehydrase and lipid transport domain-containing protein n=1 Tax=Ditylenchus destructor TaxID=166010 RepID=A0AAD4R489_9BILA|nr:polyketide cyclase / dehydrase and lipid transport domain-containing protein [Ditylenchus destructor]